MEELLRYFDVTSLLMAVLLTSLFLAVVNQTQGGQRIHNAWLAIGASIVASVFLIHWENFPAEWQSIGIQFFLTVMIATLLGVSRGQDVLDSFFGWLMNKTGIKKNGQ